MKAHARTARAIVPARLHMRHIRIAVVRGEVIFGVPFPMPRPLAPSHRFRLVRALVACIALALPSVLLAHGEDQPLLDALTEELAKAPEADLFIRRGELYRHHQEWDKAEADLAAAARLDPKLKLIEFLRARLMLESGAPAKAQPLIERYLATVPDDAEGWFLRGEIAHALGQSAIAASHYAEGLKRVATPRTDHYLRRARILAAVAPFDRVRVLAAIDEGLARVGPALSLIDYAISLDLDASDYAAALQRIAYAMETSPRQERWLARRGEILARSGRKAEAIASYRAALAALEALPERYRDTVPMEKLAADTRQALANLGAP